MRMEILFLQEFISIKYKQEMFQILKDICPNDDTVEHWQRKTDTSSSEALNTMKTARIFYDKYVKAYQNAVTEVDTALPAVIEAMGDQDVMIITADHGCDPTFRGTDHTREYVPLLWYSESRQPVNLGERGQFCDVAQTISASFGAGKMKNGEVLFAP